MDIQIQKNPQTLRSRSFTLFFRPREAYPASAFLFVVKDKKSYEIPKNYVSNLE